MTDAIEPHELAIIEPSAQLPAMLQAEMQRASDRARSAKSVATRRAYQSDFTIFAAWCAERGVSPMPAAPELVATFLNAEAERGARASTITRPAAAIRFAHKAATAWPTLAVQIPPHVRVQAKYPCRTRPPKKIGRRKDFRRGMGPIIFRRIPLAVSSRSENATVRQQQRRRMVESLNRHWCHRVPTNVEAGEGANAEMADLRFHDWLI